MNKQQDPTFKEALVKSLGLLFAVESKKFTIIKFDTPYIYANVGVFEVCFGEIVDRSVEITPMGVKGRNDMPDVDWYVVVFLDKQKTRDDAGNTILLKNDKNFKKKWDDVFEFAKLANKNKFWIDITN